MKKLTPLLASLGLLLLLAPIARAQDIELSIPFLDAPPETARLQGLHGVHAVVLHGKSAVLRVDPYARLTTSALAKAAGRGVDLDALELTRCAHVIVSAPGGGGGSAPCLESPTGGCFAAGPVTNALTHMPGVTDAKLVDMRPGGALAWLVVPELGKTLGARKAIDRVLHSGHGVAFLDLVLSGVFADGAGPIPSEHLPRMRPGAVRSASPLLHWEHDPTRALARAANEQKMLLLVVHHFD